MNALKIQKADIFGYSLGSFITQQFAISHPDKVNSVILVASTCGGKAGIPKPPERIKVDLDMVNKTKNNISIPREEMKTLLNASLGPGWIKLHPESLDLPLQENFIIQQLASSLTPKTMNTQTNAGYAWMANNWNGACDDLAKIAKPTLVITGTDDISLVPHENSLIIASKVPGAWLVQIKNAGHAIITQYSDKVANIVQTFLSTIK